MWSRGRHLAWLALVAALAGGCDGADTVESGEAPGQVVTTFEDGGVTVALTLSATQITTAQRVEVSLDVRAPEGATVNQYVVVVDGPPRAAIECV